MIEISDVIMAHKRSGLLEIENEDAKKALHQLEESIYNSDVELAKILREHFYMKYETIANEIQEGDPTFWPSVNAFIARENITVK